MDETAENMDSVEQVDEGEQEEGTTEIPQTQEEVV